MYRGQDGDSPVELESQFVLRLPPVSTKGVAHLQNVFTLIFWVKRSQQKCSEKPYNPAAH